MRRGKKNAEIGTNNLCVLESLEPRLFLSAADLRAAITTPEFSQTLWGRTQVNLDSYPVSDGKLMGDANGDGQVTQTDLTRIARNWSPDATNLTWRHGDFSGDGAVDDLDAALLMRQLKFGGNGLTSGPRAGMEDIYNAAMYEFKRQEPGFYKDAFRRDPGSDMLAWVESYSLQAYMNMYEATGDHKYLLRMIDDFDIALANRNDRTGKLDEYRNKVMPAWTTSNYDGFEYAYLFHNAMIQAPMARFAYIVRRDPTLKYLYGAKANEYAKAINQTLKAFNDEWREGSVQGQGYYINPRDGQMPPALNHSAAIGKLLVNMYLATGNTTYRDRAAKIGNYIKAQMKIVDNAYYWAHWPARNDSPDDLPHGAMVMEFAKVAHDAGIVFTSQDLQLYANRVHRCAVVDTEGKVTTWYARLTAEGPTGDYGYLTGPMAQVDDSLLRMLVDYMPLQGRSQMSTAADLMKASSTVSGF